MWIAPPFPVVAVLFLISVPFRVMRDFVPSVIGMGARDAVYLLESRGIKVNLVGVGKVKSQSIANGTRVRKGQTIVLHLN